MSRSKLFTRRVALLAGAKTALLSALVGRLYYLQVLQADQYKMLSDDNRISLRLLAPPRGRILDRFGVELASNRRNYRVLLVAEQTDSVSRTLDMLGKLINVDDVTRARILREVERKRKFMPVSVTDNLSWEEFARININSPDLPGVVLDVGETRDYPFGAEFSHLVGYVAAVSDQELTDNDDPLLELPGFRIGKSGVEKIYDLDLRGEAGDTRVEVNAYGRVIRELARNDGQPGNDVVLTIDAELQRFTMERLSHEESATAVLMDVKNGDVLAMASSPAFDPNWFNVGITGEQWRGLNGNKFKPLVNKAIQGQYPPGSTFKPVVALAALEAGVITPDFHWSCSGQMELGNALFHCWRKGGHGTVNVVDALEGSCDIFFYEVARRLGPDRIADMAKRMGLGGATGIDLPNERNGLMPTKEWKRATYGSAWTQGDSVVAGIGQGYVLATPMQLVVQAARIANGGFEVKPRLVRPSGDVADSIEEDQELPSLGISKANMVLVQEGMNRVTNSARGTAFRARITEPGMAMAGKSGSSQVRRITMRDRESGQYKKEKPWEERDHALFIAYAPVDNPRYAVAVLVEHGVGGGVAAAPICRDMLRLAQKLDPSRRTARDRFAGGCAANAPDHLHGPGCGPAMPRLADYKPMGG